MNRSKPLQRKAFPKQRKPLPKAREQRRRNEGRVTQERMKVRRVKPDAEAERFWDSLPNECQGCGGVGEVIHHILASVPGKISRRDHFLVAKLCARCHNMGDGSVHGLGSEAKFLKRTGVDLVSRALTNLENWRLTHGA
jgi:hypothetical protein